MSNTALTLEALFGDLNLDLTLEPEASPEALGLPYRFAADAEVTLDLVGFTPASSLLTDADPAVRPTRPYDIPEDEFAQAVTMWGDDERFSALSTAPVPFDELPEDAYPTQFTLLELE